MTLSLLLVPSLQDVPREDEPQKAALLPVLTSTHVAASQTRTTGLVPASPDATKRPLGLTRRAVICFPWCPRKYRWLFEKWRGA